MEQVRLTASGLWTDPNELTAPEGGLREALNVRIKRANLIEPRPGFPAANVVEDLDSWQVFSWAGVTYAVFGGELWYVPDALPSEVTAGGASLEIVSSWAFAAAMGRCFYALTTEGAYRIAEPGDTTAVPAGVATGTTPLITPVVGSLIGSGQHVSMRVVFNETVNGQLLLGAPSAPFEYENTGAGGGVSLQIRLPDAVTDEMVVQVYRTLVVAAATPTGDEMALAVSATITSADVTAGYVTVTLTADTALGASLYTNETQEGILQAAYPPPRAKCLAWWKNMAFYGDTSPLANFYLFGETRSASSDAIGSDAINDNGTATMGSAVITGLVGAPFFSVGMYVTKDGKAGVADSVFQAFSRIIAVGATSITLDKTALSSTAVAVIGLGVLEVDGVEFINGNLSDTPNKQFGSRQDLVALLDAWTDVSLVVSDYESLDYTLTWTSMAAFSVEYLTVPNGTLVGLYSTTPTPAVAGSEGATPSRVAWSKTLQPEAVPLLQYQDIGDWRQPVMRLIPTRDSLFVLKADGVWRITGDSPDSLRFEDFDLSVRLIHRRAADAHDNRVWAWTSLGVVAFSEAGVERISEPSIRSAIESQQQLASAHDDIGGVFITGCVTQGCVLVGVPGAESTGPDNTSAYVYVFETNTGAWVRWEVPEIRGAIEHDGNIIAVSGDGDIRFQRDLTTDRGYPDTEVTSTSETGTWVVLEGDDLPEDLTGFRLMQGGVLAWITGPGTGDQWLVTHALDVGDVVAIAPFRCEVEWLAAPTSGALIHWRQLRAQLSSLTQVWRMVFGVTSERVPTETTVRVDFPRPFEEDGVNAQRFFVSRAQSRSARLRVIMRVISAGQRWLLNGLTLTGDPMRSGDRLP